MAIASVAVKLIPEACDCKRAIVALNALTANFAATALPMLPLAATLEFRQVSYGAPELFNPTVSTRISILTSFKYS